MSLTFEKGEIVYTTKGSKINSSSNEEGLPQSSKVNSIIKDTIVIEKPFDNSMSPLNKKQKTLLQVNSNFKSPPIDSNRKMKKKKKLLTFREPFEDIIPIESFKSYNELMTYTDYFSSAEEPTKKSGLCNTIKLCAKKVCIIY